MKVTPGKCVSVLLGIAAVCFAVGWALSDDDVASSGGLLPDSARSQSKAEPVSIAAPSDGLSGRSSAIDGAVVPREPSFDEVYADILRAMSEVRAKEAARAPESEREACRKDLGLLFEEMVGKVRDSGPKTVSKILSLGNRLAEDGAMEAAACRLILDFSIQVMSKEPDLKPGRASLVSSMVESFTASVDVAKFFHGILQKRNCLEMVHEPLLKGVLDACVGDLQAVRPLAMDLLLELWATADSGSASLLALAEGAEGQVAAYAALARLLLIEKYRDYAIAKLVASRDATVMDQASLVAARTLGAKDAIHILASMKSTAEGELHSFSGYAVVAERFPDELSASYLDALAQGVMPAHRENAMQNLAHLRGEKWAELARTALAEDSNARVRGVALLGLAPRLRSDAFGPLFESALADPRFLSSECGPSPSSAVGRDFGLSAARQPSNGADDPLESACSANPMG